MSRSFLLHIFISPWMGHKLTMHRTVVNAGFFLILNMLGDIPCDILLMYRKINKQINKQRVSDAWLTHPISTYSNLIWTFSWKWKYCPISFNWSDSCHWTFELCKKKQLLISNLKCQGQIVNFSYQVQGQIIIKNKPQSNIDRCLNKVSYKCLLLCYF